MKIWKEVSRFIARIRTSTLTSCCFLIGLMCMLPLMVTNGDTGSISQSILISLMFFFWGLAGLPIIVRRDADFGLFRIEGLFAVLLGAVLIICSLVLALMPLW